MTETEILYKKAIKGNHEALFNLINSKKSDIYKLAYCFTKNEPDSLDIFQETVYHALKSLKSLRNPEYFDTWITRITINCCKNFLKSKKRITYYETLSLDSAEYDNIEPYETAVDIFENLATRVDISSAIDRLDVNLKTIIILRFYKDLSLEQISDIISCPLSTVKTRLYRAMSILKKSLQDYSVL